MDQLHQTVGTADRKAINPALHAFVRATKINFPIHLLWNLILQEAKGQFWLFLMLICIRASDTVTNLMDSPVIIFL